MDFRAKTPQKSDSISFAKGRPIPTAPQLLDSRRKKVRKPSQRLLDLAGLSMRTRERQRRLPLMARLSTHRREEQRSTRDGFRMAPGNRQSHKHRPPVIDSV